jgi:RNA polymerase sigma factor (sigma-70 family)
MAPLLSAPLLRAQSDRRLAALAADGHDRAFEAIVERYRRPLHRYLRRLLSEALAEDVLQATFVRAWQALRAGTDVRELRPWLYRIAHNQALNTLRAAGSALPAVTADLPAISLEAEVERREELREALHGIEALPDRQRAALVAIAAADRPHADVARELGMSDGALRQLLLRARTALRAAATALTPYPLMSWLADGQEVTAARVAEVAVGAGGAGVALKASVAALAAGAVVAGGPALHEDRQPAPATAGAASEEPHREPAARSVASSAGPVPSADHQAGDQNRPVDDHAGRTPAASRSSSHRSRRGHRSGSNSHGAGSGGSGSGGSGSEGSDEHSGSSGSGSGHSGAGSEDSAESDSRGSGSGSGESSGKGSSGKQSSGGDGSGTGPSGRGSSGEESSGTGDTAVAPATPSAPLDGDAPTITIAPAPSNSGESSESSGSDSGSNDSGSSGSDGSGGD